MVARRPARASAVFGVGSAAMCLLAVVRVVAPCAGVPPPRAHALLPRLLPRLRAHASGPVEASPSRGFLTAAFCAAQVALAGRRGEGGKDAVVRGVAPCAGVPPTRAHALLPRLRAHASGPVEAPASRRLLIAACCARQVSLAGRGRADGKDAAQLFAGQTTRERPQGSALLKQMLEDLGGGKCMCTKCTKVGGDNGKLNCVDIETDCAAGASKEGYFFVKCVRTHPAPRSAAACAAPPHARHVPRVACAGGCACVLALSKSAPCRRRPCTTKKSQRRRLPGGAGGGLLARQAQEEARKAQRTQRARPW